MFAGFLRDLIRKYNLLFSPFYSRLTITMIIIVACFFTVFTPYAVLIFWEGFGGGLVSEQHSFAAMLMAYSNSMIDFWVYALMNVKFRKAVADLLCGKVKCGGKSWYLPSTASATDSISDHAGAASTEPSQQTIEIYEDCGAEELQPISNRKNKSSTHASLRVNLLARCRPARQMSKMFFSKNNLDVVETAVGRESDL